MYSFLPDGTLPESSLLLQVGHGLSVEYLVSTSMAQLHNLGQHAGRCGGH